MFRMSILVALTLFAPLAAAAESAAQTPPSRYSVEQARIETQQRSEHFSARGRIAPVESAGELREGQTFTLIGRLAKAGSGCPSGDQIFKHGFE